VSMKPAAAQAALMHLRHRQPLGLELLDAVSRPIFERQLLSHFAPRSSRIAGFAFPFV
jgi:hypothetical protein